MGLLDNLPEKALPIAVTAMLGFYLLKQYRRNQAVLRRTHYKARGMTSSKDTTSPRLYASLPNVFRSDVPNDKVSWKINFPAYKPNSYTHDNLKKQPVWADPLDPSEIDRNDYNRGKRVSYCGKYRIDGDSNRPLNPVGRTGICERGRLGKWGPNHAADPLVVRRNPNNPKVYQFVAIERQDTKEWAIPGGMVEAGDDVSATLKKEFMEETQNCLDKSEEQQKQIEEDVKQLFNNPTKVLYRGYVDDPRNTDNSWMETTCTLFFDSTGELTDHLQFEAGDDASNVKWVDITDDLKLYASHADFVRMATNFLRQ